MSSNIVLHRVLLVIAIVCFVVAWLMTAGTVNGGNPATWGYAGLTFLAGSFLP